MAETDCGADAAAYALGALDPSEAQAFERHLESCAVCRDEVAAFGLVVDALPLAVDQHRPSRRLRWRTMRAIRAEPRAQRPRRLAAVPRPALAAAVVIAALAIAAGVDLGTAGPSSHVFRASVGDARVSVEGGHAVLVVSHLPPAGSGRIYEMWLQHGDGAPTPSTLFGVDARGGAHVGVPGSVSGVRRVLVTNEPAQGTPKPTSPPVIVATLG